MGLSAEAQHVIDSLEAHLGAVQKAAADSGSEGLISSVNFFADKVHDALAEFGVVFRSAGVQESPAAVEETGDASAEAAESPDAA